MSADDDLLTPDSPPVAPEEAVRLVDALTQAAYQKGSAPHASLSPKQLLEARTALLNYIAAQANRIESEMAVAHEYERQLDELYPKLAALTAEKEAMQKAILHAKDCMWVVERGDDARMPYDNWQAILDALTPKPPIDTTEAPKP